MRYAETDTMGVVYYANFFVWFEVARTDFLRNAGWTYREMEREGFLLPVLEAHCEYRQWAKYDDELDIVAAGELMSHVRVKFEYTVVRPDDGAVLAVGRTLHASIDRGGRPCRLPARVRAVFQTEADLTGPAEHNA